jgi:hypothetical protein
MPNKTIYLRDADLPLFEQAQEEFGDSVSSLFAEFLRDRVAKLTPDERRIMALMNQITRKREALKKDGGLPGFIDGEYAEGEAYAEKALKSFRAGEIRNAKTFFYAANLYHEWAERDVKHTRELNDKIAEVLRGNGK